MWRIHSLGIAFLLGSAGLARPPTPRAASRPTDSGASRARRFTDLCESKKEECKLTGTWIEGYLSGYNALSKDTFDILPWQPPEALAEFTFNVCKENPQAPMLEVVNALIRDLLVPAGSRPPPIGRRSATASSRWRSTARPCARCRSA